MMMVQKSIKFLLTLMIAFFSVVIFAQHEENNTDNGVHHAEGNQVDTREEIKDYIKHHLKDSHDFHFYTDNKQNKHYSIPLPVIVWTSNGLRTFMSSEFHHNDDGTTIVESDGVKLTKIHSKIYELESGSSIVNLMIHTTQQMLLGY
jgi:F-type H+-transporting ATPase subunit a